MELEAAVKHEQNLPEEARLTARDRRIEATFQCLKAAMERQAGLNEWRCRPADSSLKEAVSDELALRADPDQVLRRRKAEAAQWLLERITAGARSEKERVSMRRKFCMDNGIPDSTWSRFANGGIVPTDSLLDVFVNALDLSAAEAEELRRMAVRELFKGGDLEVIRAETRQRLRDWAETVFQYQALKLLNLSEEEITRYQAGPEKDLRPFLEEIHSPFAGLPAKEKELRQCLKRIQSLFSSMPGREGTPGGPFQTLFEQYSGISSKVLDKLLRASEAQPSEAEPPLDPADSVSKKVLLKLIVAFAMPEEEAKAFLAEVGAGFVARRDLVVQACIRHGIYRMDELYVILGHYRLEQYEKSFQNLYKDSQVSDFCELEHRKEFFQNAARRVCAASCVTSST